MKKVYKILIGVVVITTLAVLTGLIVTGAVVGWGPFAFIKFNRAPVSVSPKEYVYTATEMHCKNGEKDIFGTLYVPEDGKETRGILILSHGLNSTSTNNAFLAKSLASSGVAVYAYDFCGGSISGKSDGKTTEMSVVTEMEDLTAVLEMVKTWEWVDQNHIVLFGESQGGCVSAMLAPTRDDISCMVLYYPALVIPASAEQNYLNIEDIPEEQVLMGITLGKAYYEDIYGRDAYTEAAEYTGDVLIVHGTADTTVPYESSVKMDEMYQNSTLYKLEGAGHGFSGDQEIEALKQVYEFLCEQGCGADAGSGRAEAQAIIETEPAQKEGYETFATKLPLDKELKKESGKPGTVVEFTYETRADALEVTKKALVYLPYGYDESKRYDILYLMHGGGESEYYWLGDETMISGNQKTFGKTTRNVLDNMIASGLSKEVIVVAPTFYTEGNNAYVDGNNLCIAFAKELREDLIPAIESKYSTYAGKDTSVEGLQKSRDHRAFAGFSMGSFTTIQAAMMRNLDVFSYFGAMSGSLTELSDFKEILESEEYKDLSIHYMYNGNGTNDIAHDEHKELCIDILAEMSDRFIDGENFAWIDYEGGYHAYNSWITDLHNCLTVFFQ